MKSYRIFTLILCLFTISLFGQNLQEKYQDKVQSCDSIIQTLYDVISGDKTEPRNWELFKYLFKENAQLISTRKTSEGVNDVFYMSVDQYVENADVYFRQNNFFEREIFRKTEQFGSLTHIFSTYETLQDKSADTPIARGINSIQLFNDGIRWWIINIYWSSETKANQIPKQYLP